MTSEVTVPKAIKGVKWIESRADGTNPNVGALVVDPHMSKTSWGASAIEPLKPLYLFKVI